MNPFFCGRYESIFTDVMNPFLRTSWINIYGRHESFFTDVMNPFLRTSWINIYGRHESFFTDVMNTIFTDVMNPFFTDTMNPFLRTSWIHFKGGVLSHRKNPHRNRVFTSKMAKIIDFFKFTSNWITSNRSHVDMIHIDFWTSDSHRLIHIDC